MHGDCRAQENQWFRELVTSVHQSNYQSNLRIGRVAAGQRLPMNTSVTRRGQVEGITRSRIAHSPAGIMVRPMRGLGSGPGRFHRDAESYRITLHAPKEPFETWNEGENRPICVWQTQNKMKKKVVDGLSLIHIS